MPRKPDGDKALTQVQRNAKMRQRKAMTVETWRQALERIRAVKTAREAREIAEAALSATTLRYGNRPEITVTTPTKGGCWMDLWNAAEHIVEKSGEVDHTFVENFDQTDKPGVLIVRLGS